jgi:hypothetical protein
LMGFPGWVLSVGCHVLTSTEPKFCRANWLPGGQKLSYEKNKIESYCG